MTAPDHVLLTRRRLLEYFEDAFAPRDRWQVGMELEKMGRDRRGRPFPYDGSSPSVREVLERYLERRGGVAVYEGEHLIGLNGDWGSLSLEPAGQVEWSSRPYPGLGALRRQMEDHLSAIEEVGRACGVTWLEEAVDPVHPASEMPWMPKARYGIMRPYMGRQGRLAHRMMTQTASIQCAFDFADADDWRRKFVAAAKLSPVAVALFANSSRVDGRDSGWKSYRQAIWRETDPDRCGLPAVVFEDGFDLERWMEWACHVPSMFVRRARGLAPTEGTPFCRLLEATGCDALETEDWELQLSSIFTDVRSYRYIEVRTADLMPDELSFAVPAFWTGLLYDPDGLALSLEVGGAIEDHADWMAAMESAGRLGLDGAYGERPLREVASVAVRRAAESLEGGAACAGDDPQPTAELVRLDRALELDALV